MKKQLLAILGLAISSFCYGQNYYEDGRNEYFNGDLNKSVDLFTEAIHNGQEVASSYMMRGAAEGLLNKLSPALMDLNVSLLLDSTNFKLYYYFGRAYIFADSFNLALKYYDIAISKSPDSAFIYDDRAIAKSMLNDVNGAIKDEDVAIRLDSTDANFYVNRGWAKSVLKQYDKAIEDYNISIKIKPGQKAYADRGLALAQLGKHLKAIEDFTKSLSIIPEDKAVLYYRGISYKALGKKKEACLDFTKSVKLGYQPSVAEQKGSCY